MPVYVYADESGHRQEVMHRMLYGTAVICGICSAPMQRVPQMTRTNWRGLRPSQGEVAPVVRRLIETAPERRDKFQEVHEEHERRTQSQTARGT